MSNDAHPHRRLPNLTRRLRILAAKILAAPSRMVQRVLRIRQQDRYHKVEIVVSPAKNQSLYEDTETAPLTKLPPEDQRVIDALSGKVLLGKEIASAVGARYDSRFKAKLSRLRKSGDIIRSPTGDGYTLPPNSGP